MYCLYNFDFNDYYILYNINIERIFLKQRISIAIQRGIAIYCRGTFPSQIKEGSNDL